MHAWIGIALNTSRPSIRSSLPGFKQVAAGLGEHVSDKVTNSRHSIVHVTGIFLKALNRGTSQLHHDSTHSNIPDSYKFKRDLTRVYSVQVAATDLRGSVR